MTWLARISLANRALVGLVTALLLLFGALATGSLRQELLPSFQAPLVTVVAPYPGASADVVAAQVTEPIEAAVAGVAGVTDVTSTSAASSAVLRLELEYGTDLDGAVADVERAVAGLALPEAVEPSVGSADTEAIPVVALAVSSGLSVDDLATRLREDVEPLLAGLDGVGAVTVTGLTVPQVTIALDAAAAAERGVSTTVVTQVLRDNGVRVPAGEITPGADPLPVTVGTSLASVEQLADLYVSTAAPGADPVRLGEIATVSSAPPPVAGYTRTDGVDSVGITLTRLPDANTVEVADRVTDALGEVRDLLGGSAADTEVTVVFDQAPFISQSVKDLLVEGLLGLLFAVLVILAFLASVRATVITAVSIPLSVLIALIVLDVGGYTLNILTLGALTVAVGRVVDDSIVVVENIKRQLGRGVPRPRAVVQGVREVAGAITASTITTVAVFLPIALVSGQVGELFRPFGVTVTAALLASLLVSLTVVPVLASLVLRAPAAANGTSSSAPPTAAREDRVDAGLRRAYLPVLRGALARPVAVLLAAVLLLIGTGGLYTVIPQNFLGDTGGDNLTIDQELPAGTPLAQVDTAAREVEAVLADTDGVRTYQVVVGDSSGRVDAPELGIGGGATGGGTQFTVSLDEDADADAVLVELRDRLSGLGPQDQVGTVVVSSGLGGFGRSDLAVQIRADDPAVLAQAAELVADAAADVDSLTTVRNTLTQALPAVDVTVDRAAAAAQGLTETQVAGVVAGALRGVDAGVLTVAGVDRDVLVRTADAPVDVAALGALPVGTTTLGELATITETTAPPSILRTDGERTAEVLARPVDPDDLAAATADLQAALDDVDLPEDATAKIGGASADQADAFGQLGLALLVAIAIVFLVMAATFRSLLQPLVLLVSVPFAATGAFGLLWLSGIPLGVPAIIGMLMLVGIVVTNAIVLIDRVNQFRRAGRPVAEAVVDGAAQRLRPILMTAVATVFALVPMGLGLTGGGAIISQPLAVVVIGGLVSSTLLTLVLVPVLYLLVERGRERRRGGPVVAGGADDDTAARTGPITLVDAAPPARPTLSGTVSDHGGRPLAGAAVTVLSADGSPVAAVRTGPDGRYRVTLAAPGEHLVSAQSGDREPSATWVGAGPTPIRADLVVDGPAAVTGRVRRISGSPVPAVVTLLDRDGRRVAGTATGPDGSYLLTDVPAGAHRLLVAPRAGTPTATPITVPPTGEVTLDVTAPA